MGQNSHRGRASTRWTAAVGCLALVAAAPLLSGCGTSLAAATTTLAGAVDVQVVHPDGTVVGGVDGLRLRRGDLVRTGPAGRAELKTRGRVVYAASEASVQVLDGARQQLRHGAVVVDAQGGPRLTLTVAGLTATAPGGTALRAERAVTVRIASLAGTSSVDSDTGRHLDVPALTQAVIGGDALPDSTADSPLRLTDDDGEAHAVPTLVRDDVALQSLAAGIDSTGTHTFQVVTAAWHRRLDPLPAGVARSEQVLPVVIAAAIPNGDALGRYDVAVRMRQAGGSWGVVAHDLGTTSSAVLAALDAFEHGAATGQVGTVPAALAFVSGALQGTGGDTSSSGQGGSSSDSPKPQSSPTPQPTASATGSPGAVTTTIDKVLSLLPTSVPTPLPTPTSVLPVPVPVPSLPVVGGVVKPVPVPTLPH
jgi:hypothetical protein